MYQHIYSGSLSKIALIQQASENLDNLLLSALFKLLRREKSSFEQCMNIYRKQGEKVRSHSLLIITVTHTIGISLCLVHGRQSGISVSARPHQAPNKIQRRIE